MERWFKDFNNEIILNEDTNQTDGGLMHFLMGPIKVKETTSPLQSGNIIQKIGQEQLHTFFEINNVLTVICRYLSNGERLNPLKISMSTLEGLFEQDQKQFALWYKTYHCDTIKAFIDQKETYVQFKQIQEQD
jgi:hypothetical protein